ncbi:MAG: DUF3574 domain-containing protein [Rhodospirillaceae bacterium]|nr:DUF3574 domain-containing protein [Rhodospirillaceae bacterium]
MRFFRALRLIVLLTVVTLPFGIGSGALAADAVQTALYFGLKTDEGAGVSEQAWAHFLADVVTPRFPAGLTVVNAYGQSDDHGPEAGMVIAQGTRMLILVHPADDASAASVAEIKAAWNERFPTAGLFHTEADVRIVE